MDPATISINVAELISQFIGTVGPHVQNLALLGIAMGGIGWVVRKFTNVRPR